MHKYLLEYGQPRPSLDGKHVIYEAKQLRAEHPGDIAAIRWACEVVSDAYGITKGRNSSPAAPTVLWRVDPGRNTLIWERERGLALRRLSYY